MTTLPTRSPSDDDTATYPTDEGVWRLATALSGAVTPIEVAGALADEGAVAADASFANLAILEASTSRVRVVHHAGIDPTIIERWTEFDLDTPTPLCKAMTSGLPVLLDSIDSIARRYPEMWDDTVAAGLNATASLPLLGANGTALGAVGFGWPNAQRFGTDQVRRLDLIAQLAAQALERAALYEHEHEQALNRERADARLIQEAFLPSVLPNAGSLDVAATYLPASNAAMGGDWYDVFPVDGGTCLVIGDVAGHGLQSAAVMAQLRNSVRAYAIEDPSPASVLTRLNRMMCRLHPDEFASAIVALWDDNEGTLLRSNAGHPPVLRCRRGEFGYLIPPSGRLLLGVAPDQHYQEELKVLRPGTTLLLYTDGLIEWRGQDLDDGMGQLLAFVEQLDDITPAALCRQIRAWRFGMAPQDDDICMLAVRLT